MKRLTLQRNWIPILVTLILGFAFVVPVAANDNHRNNHQCGYGYAYGGQNENEQGDEDEDVDEDQDEDQNECDEDQGHAAGHHEVKVTLTGQHHDEPRTSGASVKVQSRGGASTQHSGSSSEGDGEDD